jgi:hypothetical protein
MMRGFTLALTLILGACADGGGKGDDNDTDGDGVPDDDTGDTDDSGGDSDVAPSVTSVDLVDCSEQQSAGEIWQISLTVTDPQGIATVHTGAEQVLNEAGGELANYVLACSEGTCNGGFRADYDGIACSLDGSISFAFAVTDEDGNVSATKTYATTGE